VDIKYKCEPTEEEIDEMEKDFKEKPKNPYIKNCKGTDVDVYDVLVAFNVTNPAMAHAIKKMLVPGKRGVKSVKQDMQEAIASIKRAIELEGDYSEE